MDLQKREVWQGKDEAVILFKRSPLYFNFETLTEKIDIYKCLTFEPKYQGKLTYKYYFVIFFGIRVKSYTLGLKKLDVAHHKIFIKKIGLE